MSSGCLFFRAFLYILLLVCSAILLGFTAYHIHFTENLSNGDILYPGLHNFYVPIVVELLVTSCLGVICSVVFLVMIVLSPKGFAWFIVEVVSLIILWVMWLVGASIITHRWPDLGWCRGFYLLCRIITNIIAFSWINWSLAFFLIIARLVDSKDIDQDATAPQAHGREISQPTGNQPATSGPA